MRAGRRKAPRRERRLENGGAGTGESFVAASHPDLPAISPLLFAWFERYGRRYAARHFHALRLAQRPSPAATAGRPLVVYFNHPSWWDPMVCLCLLRESFPGRRHYAPIDAQALERYRFFAKLGFFGVELGSFRGARRFLAVSQALLAVPDTVLWVAAEGRFADPRSRPLLLRPGLGHLAVAYPDALFLPLALEYPFWEERFPEALLRFGEATQPGTEGEAEEAIDGEGGGRVARRTPEWWNELLRLRLERAMDALAADAMTRDPGRFESVLRGGAGVGGVYDLWRRCKARLRGEPFQAAHGGQR